MLSANKEKLASFFDGKNQFQIPFFQRAYVWQEDNWQELWDDVLEELTALQEGDNSSEHFIGTIIIKSQDKGQLGLTTYDFIDGQQRLTTVCLLLRALHDVSIEKALKRHILGMLIFSDSYGHEYIRLQHSEVDRDHFANIIQAEDNNNALADSKSRIVRGYKWFRKQAAEIAEANIRQLVSILMEKLPVIHMALSVNDDVQQIFDTINSLGVKLTVGELLKNHLFSYPELTAHYPALWKNIFEKDEHAVRFWESEKTAGRVPRSNIDLFLYSYLIIKTGANVKLETLFKEFKAYLKDKTASELLHFAQELAQYASIYAGLPEGPDLYEIRFDEPEKRFFHIINELDVNTISPLVLYIYKEVTDNSERLAMLRLLESYIVRRTVCRLTTKNYNNLFISILNDLKGDSLINAASLYTRLTASDEATSRFPSDDDFKGGFSRSALINKYSGEVLYGLALYQLAHAYNDNARLSKSGLSVEHMMPKNWRKHWKLPVGSTKTDAEQRDSKLLTLGNLTIIKGKLNSSLRDSAWAKKQKGLQPYSSLRITTDYLLKAEWNEAEIASRAENLFKDALAIWPR
jgi:uncharacterized protein with ParB-like and HNH nuclease domain